MDENGKTSEKGFSLVVVRLTTEQRQAVDAALKQYRELGSKVKISTMARTGMRQMCEAVGVPFPSTETEPSSQPD